MTTQRDRRPEALALDPGVLRDGEICEFQSDLAVIAQGGIVVQPWRDRYLSAEASELKVVAAGSEVEDESFEQVLVHLQKSRAATFLDLVHGWRILQPGGQLLFTGTNSLGVVSAVKRLAEQLDQKPIVVANRAKARVVRFKKQSGTGPTAEDTPPFETSIESIHGEHFDLSIETRPGVFSAKRLDAGSQALIQALARYAGHKPPKRVVDLGCGTGILGIAAATIWPDAEIRFVDGDHRAVTCTQSNIDRLGLSPRCTVNWWDAREPALDTRFDLALVNPPFHQRGMAVDFGPALALFASLRDWLRPGRRALIVANRNLPYEAPLAEIGELETLQSAGGYKLLSLKRSARSSRSRGRSSPGARSWGKSKAPTRSR
ncbi:MAG: methyltransferase [Myxococcales bacterium]|nr:class I SAM-dependent methyltransferase [Myxococcales bacterium]HIK84753.1 class I SAM-dependent methyltransferase [Myxococcales bacterium]